MCVQNLTKSQNPNRTEINENKKQKKISAAIPIQNVL